MGHRSFIALALLAVPLATACSSNPTGSPSTADSGTTSDASVDAAASQDSSASVDAQTPSSDASGAYSCSYSLSGAMTEATTDAPAACGNGKIEQPSGAGDYTASFGGGFQTSAETVILVCTIASPTPPSAGATWALAMNDHAGGSCQLTVIAANSQASSWLASSNASSIAGAASITFQSAAIAHGTAHPDDVYYTYDIVLDATLKAQAAGGADVTVHGSFTQTQLPSGN